MTTVPEREFVLREFDLFRDLDDAEVASIGEAAPMRTIAAGQHIAGALVTMTDRRGEVSGTILDGQGEPASDYWILVYPADERDRGWPARRGSYGTCR